MFLVAIAVRLVYLLQYRGSAFFLAPIMDAADYHAIASALTHGQLLPSLSYRTPLYPTFLGLIYLLFGSGELMPRLVQILMGSWSCMLVQRIGERIFNRWIGLFSGLLAALTGMMVYFDLELLPTSLFVFLCLLLLLELLKLTDGEGSSLRAGLFLGLAVLTRPVVLIFLPVAFLWLVLYNKELKNPLGFALATLSPLFISLLLHLAVGSGPVLVSAQGGVNFWIGNHHQSDGATANFPGMGTGWSWSDVVGNAEAQTGRQMMDSEIDRFYWQEGFKEIRAHPGRWLGLMARKAMLFWNSTEIPNNRDFRYHVRRFPLMRWLFFLGFPLLLPFAFAGIAGCWRQRGVKLLTLFALTYFMVTVLFFVTARYRHPLTPLLIILSAGGVSCLLDAFKNGKLKPRYWLPVAGVFAIGLVLPWITTYSAGVRDLSYGYFSEGRAYEELGQIDRAEEYYLKALAENPTAPFVNHYLAGLARQRGDLLDAIDHYRRELELRPTYVRSWNDLGVTNTEMGRDDQALACFEQALRIRPDMTEAARNAARIHAQRALKPMQENNWKEALVMIHAALQYQPHDPVFLTMSLEARFHLGDKVNVRRELDSLLIIHPNLGPALELKQQFSH